MQASDFENIPGLWAVVAGVAIVLVARLAARLFRRTRPAPRELSEDRAAIVALSEDLQHRIIDEQRGAVSSDEVIAWDARAYRQARLRLRTRNQSGDVQAAYALPKTTFPEQVVTSLRAGQEVKADTVEVRQPLFTVDASDVLYELVQARIRGIVHVAVQQGITKDDWAIAIARLLGLDTGLIQSATPPPDAKRPVRSWLHDRRLRELGFRPLRPVLDATQAFLAESGLQRALRARGASMP